MKHWNENLDYFYGSVKKISGLRVIKDSRLLDRSKINIDTSGLGITAAEFENAMMESWIFS